MQAWKESMVGTEQYSLAQHLRDVSFGRTLLDSYDFLGPIDLGCPACGPHPSHGTVKG